MKKTLAFSIAAVIILISVAVAVVPASATHALPNEYKELEYIESEGFQVIDTGIPVNSKISLEVTFQIVDPELPGKGGVGGVVGVYIAGGDKTGRFQIGYSRTSDYISMGMGELLVNTSDILPKDTNKHTAVLDAVSGTFTYDGNQVGSIDPATLNINDEHPNLANFLIGATNFSKTTEEVTSYGASASKIFHVLFQKDGVPIAEFIPALRIADNYVGMYDIVRGQFFENILYDDTPFAADPAVVTTAEETTAEPAPTTAEITTKEPDTEAAPTEAAPVATEAPGTDAAKDKGCSSSAALLPVAFISLAGCAVIRKKHRKN